MFFAPGLCVLFSCAWQKCCFTYISVFVFIPAVATTRECIISSVLRIFTLRQRRLSYPVQFLGRFARHESGDIKQSFFIFSNRHCSKPLAVVRLKSELGGHTGCGCMLRTTLMTHPNPTSSHPTKCLSDALISSLDFRSSGNTSFADVC